MKKKIIFFIGLPRCGNTFLQEILDKNNLLFKNTFESNQFINYLRGYFFFDDISEKKILEKFDKIDFINQTNILFMEGITDPFIPYYRNTVEENIIKLAYLIREREEKFDFKIILLERGIGWLKSYYNMFGYFVFIKKKSWLFYKNFITDQKKKFNKLRKCKKIYPNVKIISEFLKKKEIDHKIFKFIDLKENFEKYTNNIINEIFDNNIKIENFENVILNKSDQNEIIYGNNKFIFKIKNLKKFKKKNFLKYIFLVKIKFNLILYKILTKLFKKCKKNYQI